MSKFLGMVPTLEWDHSSSLTLSIHVLTPSMSLSISSLLYRGIALQPQTTLVLLLVRDVGYVGICDHMKKGKGVDLYSASRVIASNALFVTNQSRTATACSLQTQASAAAG